MKTIRLCIKNPLRRLVSKRQKGRRAEDGPVPANKYPVQETETRNYTKRTKLNVQDSDGTLIINRGELDGGTAHTVRLAELWQNLVW